MTTPTIPVAIGPREADLGAVFKAARLAKRMNLIDTARAVGISVNSLRWHEAGARMMPTEKLFAAAKALGADPTDLGVTYYADSELDRLAKASNAAGYGVEKIMGHLAP